MSKNKKATNNRTQKNNDDFKELYIQKPGDDPQLTALSFWQDGSMGLYFLGYREAAEALILHIYNRGKVNNAIIYPLFFLLRHTVEIGLKEAIVRSCYLLKREDCIPPDIWQTHDLNRLTSVLEKNLKSLKMPKGSTWPDIKTFFIKWESADPKGEFARYSRTNEGTPFEVPGNVYAGRILENSMKAFDYIEGLLTELEEYIRIDDEISREYQE